MGYSLAELSKRTGLTQSTIRNWVRHGVVPATTPRGPLTEYEERHLLHVLAAKKMSEEGSLLRGMAARLRGADEAKLRELAGLPKLEAPKTERVKEAASATKYRAEAAKGRTLYEEIELCPGVSLRVRADADTEARRVADEIVERHALER